MATDLHKLRAGGLSVATSNHYLEALNVFVNWSVGQGLLAVNPLRKLKRLNAEPDLRRRRRALTDDEFQRLLAAVAARKSRRAMQNVDRAMIYQVARWSGLRAAELASLTPEAFDLESSPASVTVAAKNSKRRQWDVQVLPSWLVLTLRAYLTDKPEGRPVWPGKWFRRAKEMLADDLAAANIPMVDAMGRVCDFHSLRHSFITGLARANVHPKVAQRLARHSSINLTMESYTHVEQEELSAALETCGPKPSPGRDG